MTCHVEMLRLTHEVVKDLFLYLQFMIVSPFYDYRGKFMFFGWEIPDSVKGKP